MQRHPFLAHEIPHQILTDALEAPRELVLAGEAFSEEVDSCRTMGLWADEAIAPAR